MKIKLRIFILALLLPVISNSQPCLPGGINITTQSEIDSFQTNHPNCTIIEGNLVISGNEIANLNGLNAIVTVNGNVIINQADSLINLTGLDNLTSIGSYFTVEYNNSLASLAGLNKLNSIGGSLSIWSNPALSNLSGLDSLSSIGESLSLESNNGLLSLTGLENLTSIGTWLDIYDNYSLSSLVGIDNIDPGSILYDVVIFHNASLTTCEVASICDYLANPNGGINIHTNASGCNSPEEVKDACGLSSTSANVVKPEYLVYPNPAKKILFVFKINGDKITELNIYNQIGQRVLGQKNLVHSIDISGIHPGVYFIEIVTNNSNFKRKLIIE
jgi:hypothetical protein